VARFATAQTPNLIFSASFDTTLISSENEEPVMEMGISFENGIFGSGILIEEGDILQYATANNLNQQEGSLSLWVKPNWNPGEILYRFFVLGNEPRNFEAHMDEGSSLAFSVNTWQIDDKPIKVAFGNGGDWKKDSWYFLTYTWNGEEIRIFVNGNEVAYSEVGFEIPDFENANLHIGSLNGGQAFMGVMDELKIYDGPLSVEEVIALYEEDLSQLPLANAISVRNIFGTDVTNSGMTLVDWEGPIMNPALKYYLAGSEALVYPLEVRVSTKIEQTYFDLPSTTSKNGPSKLITLDAPGVLDSLLMSYYMDKDFEDENFDLTLNYQLNGIAVKQEIPVTVIDQDYDRPLTYPVTVDFSEAIDSFLLDPVIQEIVRGAAEDWLYYVDGEDIDSIGVGESTLGVGGQDHNFEEKIVSNPISYKGFYLFAYENTTELGPCFCSTGFPNVQQLQTKNGELVPIPRIGGLHLNKFGQDFGDVRPDGWEVYSPYDNWTFEGFNETDLYSIAKHEIGHAMVFEELPLFDEAQNRLGFVSPALTEYYEDTIVPLFPESLSHLFQILDPASLQTPYGGGVEQPIMASGREMLTKLDVLIMESVGYPLRENEVTIPLSLTTDSTLATTVLEPVNWKLIAKGGIPVYYYTLGEGSLPDGLVLDAISGEITGTPESIGDFPVVFNLRDYDQRKSGVNLETTISIFSQGSSAASLLSFTIDGQIGETEIDAENKTLSILMPTDTDLTALTARINVSVGASVSPEIMMPLDYTLPVEFTITSENGAVQNTWTVSVETEAASSVEDVYVSQLKLSPNPSSNFIKVEFAMESSKNMTFQIYNFNGQLMKEQNLGKVDSWEGLIDVSSFDPGVYLLQLVNDEGWITYRRFSKI
jgi:hypothetical protein